MAGERTGIDLGKNARQKFKPLLKQLDNAYLPKAAEEVGTSRQRHRYIASLTKRANITTLLASFK